jgi:hypothetical protein
VWHKSWFSHNFKGPAVKYEVAISIPDGNCIWIEGPYRGSINDLTIFRRKLKGKIPTGKLVIADKGYKGEAMITVPNPLDESEVGIFKSRVRSLHETFNRRLKIFKVLREPFRSDVLKHERVMRAIAVLTQFSIENGCPLFAL